MPDWESVYRRYTDAELAAEIARLEPLREKTMTSQGAGNKNFTRDLARIDDQYRSAKKVQGDRSANSGRNSSGNFGVVDYSGIEF